jgi:hypothetical protein
VAIGFFALWTFEIALSTAIRWKRDRALRSIASSVSSSAWLP